MRGYEVLAVGATAGCLLSHCWDKHCPIGAPRAAAVQEERSWMCRGSWPDLLDCKANSSDLGIPRGVVDVKSQHISFFFSPPFVIFLPITLFCVAVSHLKQQNAPLMEC